MMEASEARNAYGALDTEGVKWKKSQSAESKGGAASGSDPALNARVDKLVNEVASLRGGSGRGQPLPQERLDLRDAAAPVAPLQGRPSLQPRRSSAGGCEQSTRQLLAAAAGGIPPPLQAAALPAVGGARTGARPLNNLEA